MAGRRVYPLPEDRQDDWPTGEAISGRPEYYQLGKRILGSRPHITWGDDERYWRKKDEPTSPRGEVWGLIGVCWLSVQETVEAPPPGCYAGFVRVRKQGGYDPLMGFSAEWKVAVGPAGEEDHGFLRQLNRPPADRSPELRQDSETAASFSHWPEYHEANDGGWQVVHVGNVMVHQSAPNAAVAGQDGGRNENNVVISFGGENPSWTSDFDVDFAAIAPLRLSRYFEKILVEQGHRRSAGPLSRLPEHLLPLVLEYCQPTLVRPERAEAGAREAEGGGLQGGVGYWTVF